MEKWISDIIKLHSAQSRKDEMEAQFLTVVTKFNTYVVRY